MNTSTGTSSVTMVSVAIVNDHSSLCLGMFLFGEADFSGLPILFLRIRVDEPLPLFLYLYDLNKQEEYYVEE